MMRNDAGKPRDGEAITRDADGLQVPDHPIVPYIRGDLIGIDITPVMLKVVDAAVDRAYGGTRQIHWMKVYAGDEAVSHFHPGMTEKELIGIPADQRQRYYLPDETVEAIKTYLVAIKGPLTTPVGGGIRSLNVALRILLDLYVCLRPVQWYGTPAPVKNPQDLDIAFFRENTEDVYAGIEWKAGSAEADKVIRWLTDEMGVGTKIRFPAMCGIGIKPISEQGSKRLVRAAIEYAIQNDRRSVTLVHKGNIMKFTEGAFRDWGYEVAKEYPQLIAEEEVVATYGGEVPEGRILIKDRIADQFFQQMLLRPDEYDVVATMNLNGDYMSDAAAAQVGGLGVAPGANINYETGIGCFEPTHGTAPKYAGLDKVNPGSLVLSAVAMLRYMGWPEAADRIISGLRTAIRSKHVTYDLARQMNGATEVSCSAFGERIVDAL